jgi:hypothetical protein
VTIGSRNGFYPDDYDELVEDSQSGEMMHQDDAVFSEESNGYILGEDAVSIVTLIESNGDCNDFEWYVHRSDLKKYVKYSNLADLCWFEDFLEKNVYAIPFKGEYSLVTSIDYARKIGMKSGVVGKSEPKFVFDKDGNVESCTITIKRKVDNYVGDYSATVFFDEYYKPPFKKNGYEIKSLWDTKPKTMIAKVAEMHALRMACPEELAQAYIEEDYQAEEKVIDVIEENVKEEVAKIKTEEELKKYYEANKGKGKEFDKLIMNRKNEIKENAKTKTKNS